MHELHGASSPAWTATSTRFTECLDVFVEEGSVLTLRWWWRGGRDAAAERGDVAAPCGNSLDLQHPAEVRAGAVVRTVAGAAHNHVINSNNFNEVLKRLSLAALRCAPAPCLGSRGGVGRDGWSGEGGGGGGRSVRACEALGRPWTVNRERKGGTGDEGERTLATEWIQTFLHRNIFSRQVCVKL